MSVLILSFLKKKISSSLSNYDLKDPLVSFYLIKLMAYHTSKLIESTDYTFTSYFLFTQTTGISLSTCCNKHCLQMPTLDQIERISTVTKGMETCNRAIILRKRNKSFKTETDGINLTLQLLEFHICTIVK